MKYHFVVLMALAMGICSGAQGADAAHHWKIKDGENSAIIADTLNKLNGRIATPDTVKWAREDDRDWFLAFSNGGAVEIPDDKSMDYTNGFIANIKFSCDLEAIGKNNFAGLLCKGRNYKESYSIMIHKRGRVLVYLNGMTPAYIGTPAKPIQSKRDYDLTLIVGDKRMSLLLNGKVVHTVALKGALQPNRRPLILGRAGNYLFSGNIYDVSLEPYNAGKAKKLLNSPQSQSAKTTASKQVFFPELNLPDPAGTVNISDFSRWHPQPQVANSGSSAVTWINRPRSFVKPGLNTLMVPFSVAAEQLKFDPQLKGEFDCYIGSRVILDQSSVMLALGDNWHKVDLPGAGRDMPHYPVEVLVARKVKMDQKTLRLASGGTPFFLGYIKFIPSNTPRTADYPVLKGYSVTANTQPVTLEDVDKRNAAQYNELIKQGYYRERIWQSSQPEPQPAAESRKRGVMVWSPDNMTMIFPDSVPAADKGLPQLKAVMAAGENGDIAVAVRALTAQKGLTLKVDAPLKNISVTPSLVMPSVKRTTNFRGKSEFMRLPGYLAKNHSADVKAMESREFFLTVKVPFGTPAGVYRTTCTLSNVQGKVAVMPLEIKVRNFDLPRAQKVDLGFWCRNLRNNDELVSILNDYGMTSSVFNTLHFKGSTADDLQWDFENMQLAKVAEAFKKYGLSGRIHILPIQLFRRVETLPADRRKDTYVRMIRELEAHAKKNNWPERIYHSFDEVLSSPEKIAAFTRENQYLTAAGATVGADHIWYKTSRPLQKEVDAVAPLIKVFVNRCNNRNLWYVDDFPTMVRTARKQGKEVIAYNSHNAITATQPSAMRFCTGWFFRTIGNGASGQLFWTWSHYANNPANDLDGTDTVYVIPPYGKQPGGPTLELVYMREGITDLRYIQLLEKEIAAAEKRGIDTAAAQKLLDNLTGSFDMDEFRKKSVFFNSFWEKAWEKDGKRYASGDYLLPVGWKLADYSNARKQIADAIEQLKSK